MTAMGINASREPSRTIDPFPNCFSIWLRASSTALARSSTTGIGSPHEHPQASAMGRDGRRENERPAMHFVRIVAVCDMRRQEKSEEKAILT
jgi:hypothetical protein